MKTTYIFDRDSGAVMRKPQPPSDFIQMLEVPNLAEMVQEMDTMRARILAAFGATCRPVQIFPVGWDMRPGAINRVDSL
jgi:hypothetical protein